MHMDGLISAGPVSTNVSFTAPAPQPQPATMPVVTSLMIPQSAMVPPYPVLTAPALIGPTVTLSPAANEPVTYSFPSAVPSMPAGLNPQQQQMWQSIYGKQIADYPRARYSYDLAYLLRTGKIPPGREVPDEDILYQKMQDELRKQYGIFIPYGLGNPAGWSYEMARMNHPFWQQVMAEYNAGRPYTFYFEPMFRRLNDYFKQGQAQPGVLTQATVDGAFVQWAIDDKPSALSKTMSVINAVFLIAAVAVAAWSLIPAAGAGAGAGAGGGGAGAGAGAAGAGAAGAAEVGAGTTAAGAGTTAAVGAGTTAAAGAGTAAAGGMTTGEMLSLGVSAAKAVQQRKQQQEAKAAAEQQAAVAQQQAAQAAEAAKAQAAIVAAAPSPFSKIVIPAGLLSLFFLL